MNPCERCGAGFEGDPCRSCGHWPASGDAPDCELHTGVRAVACCVVCGRPVCGDCAVWTGSSFLCDDPEHRQIADEWPVVAHCTTVFEADVVAENLRQAGLTPRSFARGDHASLFWFPSLSDACVRVGKAEAEGALSLLRSLALDDESRR